jgi:hypothetical protein
MLLLTEATLIFFDLALNARMRDEEASLRSVVQAWIDGVTAATDDDSVDRADTIMNTGTTSTSYALPPIRPSTAVGQTSPTGSNRNIASESTPQNALVFSKASDDPCQVFARAVDEDAGEAARGHHSEASAGTSRMVEVRFPRYRVH